MNSVTQKISAAAHSGGDARGQGGGLPDRLALARGTVPAVLLSGRRALPDPHDVQVRRLAFRHDDGKQPPGRGAAIAASWNSCVNQSIWNEGEVDVRRPDPARVHEFRALGHQRMGVLRRLWAPQYQPAQPPGRRAAAQVHRAAGRVEVGLPDLPRAVATARPERLFRRGEERTAVVPRGLPGLGPAAGDLLEAVAAQGLLRRAARDPGRQPHAGRAGAGLPRAARRTCRSRRRCRPSTARNTCRGCRRSRGRFEFVPASLERFGQDPERPPLNRYMPSWEGRQTAALYSRYPLQLISAASALQLPHAWATPRTASSTTSSTTAC